MEGRSMSGTDARRQCPCGRCQTTTGRRADIVAGVACVALGFVLFAVADGGWVALTGWVCMIAAGGFGVRYVGDGS